LAATAPSEAAFEPACSAAAAAFGASLLAALLEAPPAFVAAAGSPAAVGLAPVAPSEATFEPACAAAAAAALPRSWPFTPGPPPRDMEAEAEAAALAALSGEVCGRGVCIRWDCGEGSAGEAPPMPPLPRLRLAGGRIALPLPDPAAALRRAMARTLATSFFSSPS
jgi:hypothetical protein